MTTRFRHSTLSFRKNVVVAKIKNKLSNVRNFIIYLDRERASPPSTEISELSFVMKRVKFNASRGVIF